MTKVYQVRIPSELIQQYNDFNAKEQKLIRQKIEEMFMAEFDMCVELGNEYAALKVEDK